MASPIPQYMTARSVRYPRNNDTFQNDSNFQFHKTMHNVIAGAAAYRRRTQPSRRPGAALDTRNSSGNRDDVRTNRGSVSPMSCRGSDAGYGNGVKMICLVVFVVVNLVGPGSGEDDCCEGRRQQVATWQTSWSVYPTSATAAGWSLQARVPMSTGK